MELETLAQNELDSSSKINRLSKNFLHILKRYGVAELASAVASTATAEIVNRTTQNETTAAYSATVAGYLAYFGTVAAQEIYGRLKNNNSLEAKDSYKILLDLVKEFGFPSYLDFAIIRPYILREGIKAFGGSVGGFLGNRIADIPFYSLCILFNKISKKKLKGGKN